MSETVDQIGNEQSQIKVGPIYLPIPSEWNSDEIQNLFEITRGVNYESKHYSDTDEGYVFLTLKSINKYGGFNWDGIKYYDGPVSENESVEPGELIIANTDLNRDADVVGYPLRVPEFDRDKIAVSMDLSILRSESPRVFDEFFLLFVIS